MTQNFKGRGALSNPPVRFEATRTEAVDDGWYSHELPDSIATKVMPERARSIISRNDSPDVPFEQSVNPYRGCEHGCVYCFARPSHAYMGLSPGLEFETNIFFKQDGAALLRAELSRRNYVCKPINLGANTDPYQPLEKKLKVTRSVLEVLRDCRHPVTIVTKGVLILRDLELLAELARHQLVSVMVSLTTLDSEVKRVMEPRAAAPQARLRMIRELSAAGIPTGVLVAPVIPLINDPEIEDLVAAAAQAGAMRTGYVVLRLPHEIKDLFREWLAEHYPLRAAHVMSLIQDLRGGRDYDARFGARMRGTGAFAELLRRRFALARQRAGLTSGPMPALTTALFRPPATSSGQTDFGF